MRSGIWKVHVVARSCCSRPNVMLRASVLLQRNPAAYAGAGQVERSGAGPMSQLLGAGCRYCHAFNLHPPCLSLLGPDHPQSFMGLSCCRLLRGLYKLGVSCWSLRACLDRSRATHTFPASTKSIASKQA